MAALIIFIVTYLLIAFRRVSILPLGRPAGALLGAVLMVWIGPLSPDEALAAIDGESLLLLFATMALSVYLERAGIFAVIEQHSIRHARNGWGLLVMVSALSAAGSSLLMNDTVCLALTPLVIELCRRSRLPLGPFLLALASSANIGSALTLVGNPQNMIIASTSGIPFARFLLRMSVPVIAAFLANLALLYLYFGKTLRQPLEKKEVPASVSPKTEYWVALAVIAMVTIAFVAGAHLGLTVLAGVMVLMIFHREEPKEVFARVDWALLIFFASIFVVVAGFEKAGWMAHLLDRVASMFDLATAAGTGAFSLSMLLGSNLVSNVPMVLLGAPYVTTTGAGETGWLLLSLVTTLAGNLTLIGSVANLIVAEKAKEHYDLNFLEHLRFGAVSALLTTTLGIVLLSVF